MTTLAAAAATVLGLAAPPALALSLGRINVLSSLGEPLRAEIEIPDINADEAATLKTSVAPPESFRAAGLEYNPAMSGLQASLQRRPDGKAFIRLTSDRAINDPFVDMIIEASWASGRIVRDYTMLFDPPSLRAQVPPAPTVAQVAPSPAMPATAAAGPAPASPGRPAAVRKDPPAAPPARPAAPPRAAELKPAAVNGQKITVQPGDTATKIAARIKPANVSLDQMLVALLRSNQNAFINDNINRIKSGAVINVPGTDEALALSPAAASRTVIAQSTDFNDFRKKLADSAPATPVAAADRRASGNVTAKIDEKKPAAAAPDKLTLSKGAVDAKSASDQIAKDKQVNEAASRAAELAKNIKELSKIGAATSAPAASPVLPAIASSVAKASTIPVAAIAPTPGPAASLPMPLASAPASAPASAAMPAKPPVAAAPAPQAESTFLDELLANPLVAPAAAGLIALLVGLGLYRARQRKNAAPVDSSFLESRLQPESFFEASGGQRVDTEDRLATGSSMVYSPSQLDAADDVDPVAEADVYLAYGRDMQAEEILKEALNTHPGRLAVHQKLLEIYAKRRDKGNFEKIAGAAHIITSGQGPEWERICELGQSIEPTNSLYQQGGGPNTRSGAALAALQAEPAISGLSPAASPAKPEPASSLDLDLDLDFSLDDAPPSAITDVTGRDGNTPTVSMTAGPVTAKPDLEMDFILPSDESASGSTAPNMDFILPSEPDETRNDYSFTVKMDPAAPSQPDAAQDVDLNAGGFGLASIDGDDFKHEAAVSFGSTAPAPLALAMGGSLEPAPAKAPLDLDMIEFDMGSISLDLEPPQPDTPVATDEPAEPDASVSDDPLGTKLALAEEFVAIGDEEGARALIEEVIAESSGDMRVKAQRALSNLN